MIDLIDFYFCETITKTSCMSLSNFSINKPKMVRFLKIKFLILLKLTFNGGQFYKKYKILVITKNCKFFSYIKFEINKWVMKY